MNDPSGLIDEDPNFDQPSHVNDAADAARGRQTSSIEYVLKPPVTSLYAAAGLSLLLAFIYSICFTGVDVLPCVSTSVFTFITMALIVILLKKMKLEINMKGYAWFIPAAIVASMNGVFSISFFNYTNVLVIFALITYAVTQISGAETKPFSLDFIEELFGYIFSVFTDAFPFVGAVFTAAFGGRKRTVLMILLAVAVSAPILFIVALLLLSADSVFYYYVDKFFSRLANDSNTNLRVITVIVMFAVFGGYARHMAVKKKRDARRVNPLMIEPVMSGTFLILLNLLFFLFCIVQVLFLFTGGFMQLPDGLVYSEYAREGFFQLLFVTIINFAALLAFLTIINGGQTGRWINRLLIMLCVFTGLLIASSLYRMTLYISAYHYTTLRMQVLTFLVMESVLLMMTLAVLFMKRGGNRFDFIHAGGMVCLIFYIIVNITGSGYLSDYLNIKAYKAEYSVGIDINNFSVDGFNLLLEWGGDPGLKDDIYAEALKRVNNRPANSVPRRWQNWSLMRSLSDSETERFVREGGE
ncbi:MAG: DUF4173 domain-containing protein [Clostridiales bacterium]|jgi:hypothetical protein|nr:DUF4173 domain-containing protein [Clostridiales bacterium]